MNEQWRMAAAAPHGDVLLGYETNLFLHSKPLSAAGLFLALDSISVHRSLARDWEISYQVMDERNPLKMKVTELKTELGRRGLSQTGLKFDLAQRLQAAMDDDEFGVVSSSSPCFSTTSALSTSVTAVKDQADSTSVRGTSPKTSSCIIPLGNLMSTVVMEREPPQRIPSRRQIEIGIGEEAYIEPIKDNAKQATNHDTSSLQDHNTKVCDVKTAAVVRQANADEDPSLSIVKPKDQGSLMEELKVVESIAIKQSPPFYPFHLRTTSMSTSGPYFAVKTMGHLEECSKADQERDETLITLDETLFQSIAGTCREDDTEGGRNEGEDSLDTACHHRDGDNVEATEGGGQAVLHPQVSVLLPESIGSTITHEKQPKQAHANEDSAILEVSCGNDKGGGGNKGKCGSISDGSKKEKQAPGCSPVGIIRQKSKAMTVEDLIRMKLMKRKVRFSTPPEEAMRGVAASASRSEVAAKLAKRAKRFAVQAGTPSASSSKADTEMGDPCGSFFPTTKSSQELTGSGPRGVKGAGFSFDPLPKRTKRSRTIEASLDKHEVPEKRREPQKVEVAKDEKNLGDADSKTYKHEELLPRDKVKLGGVSEASTAEKKSENRPRIHQDIMAKKDCISEAERKMAEQTAKMMERQRRFSSSGTWVRPKP